MTSSPARTDEVLATGARVTDDELIVRLADGRRVSVPISWYPRLVHATSAERNDCRITGRGQGIHWPGLDEDISVHDLIAGRASAESEGSLRRWLARRRER